MHFRHHCFALLAVLGFILPILSQAIPKKQNPSFSMKEGLIYYSA